MAASSAKRRLPLPTPSFLARSLRFTCRTTQRIMGGRTENRLEEIRRKQRSEVRSDQCDGGWSLINSSRNRKSKSNMPMRPGLNLNTLTFFTDSYWECFIWCIFHRENLLWGVCHGRKQTRCGSNQTTEAVFVLFHILKRNIPCQRNTPVLSHAVNMKRLFCGTGADLAVMASRHQPQTFLLLVLQEKVLRDGSAHVLQVRHHLLHREHLQVQTWETLRILSQV